MRRKMLGILCIVLFAPLSIANEQKSSLPEYENEYGIDPNRLYPGSLVIQLLQAAEEESGTGIEEAYAEGYKAGRIDAAELWRPVELEEQNRADRAEDKLARANKNILTGFLLGLVSGAASTWAIVWITGR